MGLIVFYAQCKFDFCWVCLESWKRHSSATGGYFRCNRFEAVHKADEKQGHMITEVNTLYPKTHCIADRFQFTAYLFGRFRPS